MSVDRYDWRPKTSDIPTSPGVYRYMDGEGRVIYVGKALNLRSRLSSYFAAPETLHRRTALLMEDARAVQWTVVGNEVEALTLEYQWIKQFAPRYNIMFRDDKSYPYLSVSMGEEIPRVAISRDAKKKGTRYFGPYTKVWAIRESIDLLLPTFPVRTCSAGVLRRAQAQDRPCLLGYIDRCSAPCVGRISIAGHRELAEQRCKFMDGDTGPFLSKLEAEMKDAASELDFEKAAKKRDELQALIKVQEKNTVALPLDVNADVYAMVAEELDVSVQAFFVRAGRIRGTRGWVLERVDGRSEDQLMRDLLEQVYADRTEQSRKTEGPVSIDDVAHMPVTAIPPEILVSTQPADVSSLKRVLEQMRCYKVSVKVPRRGSKKALMETVTANAEEALRRHKTKRAGDLTHRALALEGLMEALDLERAPLRVECYDISHTGGQMRVGSMVVFEDGAPRKDAYRQFNIRGEAEDGKEDDTRAIAEVLTRRFTKKEDEPNAPVESGEIQQGAVVPKRFAYEPDLIVVDGGVPQVNAAVKALKKVGVDLPLIGLAERLEEVWIPGKRESLMLPRTSPALYLLQHLRDESHRTALRAHRSRRSKAQTASVLDNIPGLGPVRQKALLEHFGSLKRLADASVEEISSVPGVGEKTAQIVKDALLALENSRAQADVTQAGVTQAAGSEAAGPEVARGQNVGGDVLEAGAAEVDASGE